MTHTFNLYYYKQILGIWLLVPIYIAYSSNERKYHISGQTIEIPRGSTQISTLASKIIFTYFYLEVCWQNTDKDTMSRVYYP